MTTTTWQPVLPAQRSARFSRNNPVDNVAGSIRYIAGKQRYHSGDKSRDEADFKKWATEFLEQQAGNTWTTLELENFAVGRMESNVFC